jgi:F-type H+-transporting ATPase subunit epsilon
VPTTAELVTPERVLFSGEADFVVLRTDGGEIMFLPEHAPFIAAVDISVLRIAPPGSTSGGGAGAGSGREAGSEGQGPGVGAHGSGEFRAAVHGGFVHVAGNKVTVLASVAEPADEIDVERARRAAEAARAAGAGDGASASETREREREERATAPPTGEHGESGEGEEPAAMRAMLYPDAPDVALRRAEARLDAAGAEIPGATSGPGGASTGVASS